MRIGDKVISNTMYLLLDWFAISILSFLFWFILGKTLQKSELGIVSTSINFIVLLSLFTSLGINNALQKLIPEMKRKKGFKILSSIVKLSIKPFVISLIFTSTILIIFSSLFSNFLKVSGNVILICVLSLICISFFAFFGSILYGLQKMKRYFITDLFQVLVRLVLSIILIFAGFSYFGPLVAFCLGFLVTSFFRVNLNYFKNNSILFSYKKLFDYAIPALISIISASLITNGQYVILTTIKNVEITGIFTVAFVITSPILVLTNVLTLGLFPIISELSSDRRMKSRQSYLIALLLRYALLLVVPISVLLIVFSKYAVLLFSSVEYLEATSYFPFLVPAALLNGFGGIFISNLYAIGKPKIQRDIMIVTALLFLLISIPLTVYFPKAFGLCLGYLTTMLIFFIITFIYIRKYLKIKFFTGDTLKILFSTSLILLIVLILYNFVRTISMAILVLIPVGLLYLSLLFFIRFYRIEDIKILKFFAKRIPFVGKYFLIIANFIRKRLE